MTEWGFDPNDLRGVNPIGGKTVWDKVGQEGHVDIDMCRWIKLNVPGMLDARPTLS